MLAEANVIQKGNMPLWIPDAGDFLPNADEYLAFRRRYPRLAGGATNAPVAAAIPFIAAAHEHGEEAPKITQKTSEVATTYEFNIPSYGYLRSLWFDINVTGGKGTAATYLGDAPFSLLEQITLLDTNGAPIFGPLSGYNAFLANLYGGYVYQQDPRSAASYNAGATVGTMRFQLRIPLEISHHDGTGCIGNQNASAPYRMRITVAAEKSVYNKKPEEAMEVNITPVLEAWSLPNAVDALGRPQAQLPPNYGTVQYWSERNQSGIVEGNNPVQVLRVGNLIRNILFIGRETSPTGTRSDNVIPTNPILNWDARQLFNEPAQYRQTRSYEPLESIPTLGRPAGVAAYTWDRTNQDRAGDDKPWLWLPTTESTRLELTGSWKTAGVVQVLVNDVAPAEVNPTQRYALASATGFHPETGAQNPNQT